MRLTTPLWALFLLGHWLACGLFAWHLLAQGDFAYPVAYDVLDIEEHIHRFGPQNRYRQGFADTSRETHIALFAEINRAVHSDPDQLHRLMFEPTSAPAQPLLREPEIVHLSDVAHLIDGVYVLGSAAISWALLSLAVLYARRAPLPRPLAVAGTVLASLAITAVVVLVIGPKKVFYALHTWAFPPDHPWFFYYQDSLMTTLMKAPDLFGFIAIVLVVFWHLLWGGSLYGLTRVWPRTQEPTSP